MLYGLNDICIIPAAISDIDSRSECNPHDEYAKYDNLPLFTAPMSCIIDDKNYEHFQKNEIYTIIPRNVNIQTRLNLCGKTFIAVSLDEFKEHFVDPDHLDYPNHVCVDVANGHMKKLLNLCELAKKKHGNHIYLMAGNIANPETYLEYAKIGIDYVRIGIGSGNVCTTSANGGIHYPMASLIGECVKIKNSIKEFSGWCDTHTELIYQKRDNKINKAIKEIVDIKSIPKIIADGGFKNFDQIIKALALGADYCMLGEIFAKTEEACGKEMVKTSEGHYLQLKVAKRINASKITHKNNNTFIVYSKKIYRDYYGMSTKRAQQELGVTDPEKLKTAEGIVKQITIDYTLSGWVENFTHYLKSTMSYTGNRTLKEFKKCKTEIMSQSAFMAYNK